MGGDAGRGRGKGIDDCMDDIWGCWGAMKGSPSPRLAPGSPGPNLACPGWRYVLIFDCRGGGRGRGNCEERPMLWVAVGAGLERLERWLADMFMLLVGMMLVDMLVLFHSD